MSTPTAPPASPSPTPARGAAAALVGATAIWGATFVVVKDAVTQMPVLDFLFWRFTLAAALMALLRPRAVARLDPLARRRGVLLGVFLGLGFIAQTVGLQTISAAVSGFVTGLMVVLTPIVAWAVFRQPVDRWAWVGVAMATLGLGMLSLHGFAVGRGEALTVLAALLYAFHIVGLGTWSTPQDAYGLTVVQVATAAVLCGVPSLVDGGLTPPPNRGVWAAVAFMAVAATAVGFVVQTWSQAHLTPTRAAVIMTMEPVFSGFFAVVLASEALSARTLLGGALVVGAMLVVELGPRRSQDAEVPRVEGL